jgi:hypothetical protein
MTTHFDLFCYEELKTFQRISENRLDLEIKPLLACLFLDPADKSCL